MTNNTRVRVPYINPSARYRPYLEIIFSNSKTQTVSSTTLGLVDSGADQISIPYSLGKQLQLEPPANLGEIKYLGGVSGSISYVERTCEIYLVDRAGSNMYEFKEPVLWLHPDLKVLEQLAALETQNNELLKFKKQAVPNTDLEKYFDDSIQQVGQKSIELLKFYESEILLGRTFFDNFDFIQFFHRDRNKEDKCFFDYVLSSRKKAQVISI